MLSKLEFDAPWQDRLHAARALAAFPGPDTIEAIEKVAKFDFDVVVRAAALETLGKIGSPSQLSLLLSALDDQEATLRIAAEAALERLPWDLIKSTVLKTVERTENPMLMRSLLSLLVKNRHEDLEQLAFRALDMAGDTKTLALRIIAKAANPAQYDRILKLSLRPQAPEQTVLAIEYLASVGFPEAEATLQHLAITSLYSAVQLAACKALSELGSEKSVPVIQAVSSTNVISVAEEAKDYLVTLQNRLGLNITEDFQSQLDELFEP